MIDIMAATNAIVAVCNLCRGCNSDGVIFISSAATQSQQNAALATASNYFTNPVIKIVN